MTGALELGGNQRTRSGNRQTSALLILTVLTGFLVLGSPAPAEASGFYNTATNGVTCWNNTGSYTLYGQIFGATGEKVWWRIWHQDLTSGVWYSDVGWKSQTIGHMNYPVPIAETRSYVGPYNAKQYSVPIQAVLEVWRNNGQPSAFYYAPGLHTTKGMYGFYSFCYA